MPFDNPENTRNNFAGVPINQDTVVYDASGDKVGTVQDYNANGGYVVVQKGLIFQKDLYIPTSAFSRVDVRGAYLSVNKDEIQSKNWETPPATTSHTSAPMSSSASRTPGSGHRSAADQGEVSVPLHEEELHASKSTSEQGRVRIHKDVVEEPETITIPVSHEEVRIEHVAPQDATDRPDARTFQEKDIEVPLHGEEATVSKDTHLRGEVRMQKRDVTEQERLSDTVRRERVDVEGLNEDNTTLYGEGGNLDDQQPNTR